MMNLFVVLAQIYNEASPKIGLKSKTPINLVVVIKSLRAITPPYVFVTTCDNEVFIGGIFMHLSIVSPAYL